jgi:hypothetical protein
MPNRQLSAQKRKPGRVNSQPWGMQKEASLLARVGRLDFRIAADDGLARHFAATLPAGVAIFTLRRGDEPQTTARLTQNG